MSVRVELDALRERVDEYGPVALLVTVGDDAHPHVVSVQVSVREGTLVAGAGKTTAANAGLHPDVTMVWPANGRDYALIVDGTARVADGEIVVEPVRAVLHRIAGVPGDGPSCVTVLDRR